MSGLRRKCPRARTRLRGGFRRSEQRTQKASLRFQEGAAETGVVGLVAARFPAFRGAAPPPPGRPQQVAARGMGGGPEGSRGCAPPAPRPDTLAASPLPEPKERSVPAGSRPGQAGHPRRGDRCRVRNPRRPLLCGLVGDGWECCFGDR